MMTCHNMLSDQNKHKVEQSISQVMAITIVNDLITLRSFQDIILPVMLDLQI